MKPMHVKTSGWERRAIMLAAVIVVQALTGLFFAGDVISDLVILGGLFGVHMWLELVAAVALLSGVVFLMIELRQMLAKLGALETALRSARGEMALVIEAFFTQWNLTPAERDVALLMLKGVDNDTIAAFRNTAPGTVRAQTAAIYAKAGVDGRAQLISIFVEELLAEPGGAG